MHKIAICIPTYQRPLMLRKLVLSIINSNINRPLIEDVYFLIADNDINKSAEGIVTELKESSSNRHTFHYITHPDKGLANIRNALIREAFLHNPDFLVFIDDDEYVTSNWLNELVNTILTNNADAVRGPVLAKTKNPIPNDIMWWFRRENYRNNERIYSLTTGNLILRRKSLQKLDTWYDNRFNNTGGEDTYFGVQILQKGAKIFWAAKAITYEIIPPSRASLKWIIMRRYRGAITFTFILKLENHYFKLIKKAFISILYLLCGLITLVFTLFRVKWRYWGIIKIFEGLGGFAGLLNFQYNEYKEHSP